MSSLSPSSSAVLEEGWQWAERYTISPCLQYSYFTASSIFSSVHSTISSTHLLLLLAFHPSRVSKWVSASAGNAKAGMVHSVSRWTRGMQVKLWDPLRTHAIPEPEHLRGVFTTRRYTNPRLPLPLPSSLEPGDFQNLMGSSSSISFRKTWAKLSILQRWRRLQKIPRQDPDMTTVSQCFFIHDSTQFNEHRRTQLKHLNVHI